MTERRKSTRFDKVFTVYLSTEHGMSRGIGKNISAHGMYVETQDPIPIGNTLKVTFCGEDGTELTCNCEVRYQAMLAYGNGMTRGMGLRIVSYDVKDDHPLLRVDRERVLH